MTRAEERSLIERASRGERAAAEALIRAHQASLYAYMLRMCGRPDMAEDVVQEAFVRVLTHLERFDFRFRFSTWLFTIARRLYVNMNQKMRPASDSDFVGAQPGRAGAPERPTIDREVRDNAAGAIDDCLMMLSPDQREALVLFHQHDWAISLIADHMGIPEGTVKSHLHRGRRKLRELIETSESSARSAMEVLS